MRTMILIWAALIIAWLIVLGIRKNKVKSKRHQLRQMVDNLEGFNASHYLIKFPYNQPILTPEPIGLAIDDKTKQACLINGETLRLIKWCDIIESEIIVGGDTITKTSRTSQVAGAAMGGLLFGGVGAVIGGLSGKKVEKQDVKDVWLKLLINDTSNPVHLLDFIELTGDQKTEPKVALKEAQKWHDLVSIIIKQAEQESKSKPVMQPESSQVSFAEQLSQLSKLHKSGALTDDELANAIMKLLSE